jgi:hypothetical protein
LIPWFTRPFADASPVAELAADSGLLDDDDPTAEDVDELVPAVSARARPGLLAITAPIPNTIANTLMRPMWRDADVPAVRREPRVGAVRAMAASCFGGSAV